jgi:hypothetical protein
MEPHISRSARRVEKALTKLQEEILVAAVYGELTIGMGRIAAARSHMQQFRTIKYDDKDVAITARRLIDKKLLRWRHILNIRPENIPADVQQWVLELTPRGSEVFEQLEKPWLED